MLIQGCVVLGALACALASPPILTEIIDSILLEQHGIEFHTLGTILNNGAETIEDANLYFTCGHFTERHGADGALLHHHLKLNINSKIAYVHNADKKMCTLSYLSPDEVKDIKEAKVQVHKYPTFMKIHQSVLSYLSSSQKVPSIWSSTIRKHKKISSATAHKDADLIAEGSTLSIELSPLAIHNDDSIRRIAEKIFQGFTTSTDPMTTVHSEAWSRCVTRHGYLGETLVCILPESAEINYFKHSIEINNLSGMSSKCIVHLVHHSVHYSDVVRVVVHPRPVLMNYEARGLTQSGRIRIEPYRDVGITGEGQICGVGDSGVNDISCFFLDDSKAYPTVTTSRNGELQPLRRKIVQYKAYADGTEDEAGHGTHVCGSIAGNSNGPELSQVDGMAPNAKIAMFDLGMTDKAYLKVPAVSEIFDTAYAAGARVHTNSWGNFGGIYGQMSYDVDAYLHDHEDFLVLFAAGNNGHDGANTIIAPANAKNCVSVGAAQNRGVHGDLLFETETRTASFSSIGPTFDGRIKPDIVAPGDYIMSAYAGPLPNLNGALAAGSKVESTCATHQMSGTSMATPVTAGTALLVRQYFMDPQHWGRGCGTSNAFCRKGSFEPSGFLLKGLFIHSGRKISRYSDPVYNAEPTAYPSHLLDGPPDNFQGYGAVTLTNILPLENGLGLDPKLSLMVFDWLEMTAHTTYKSSITINGDGPIKVTISWFDPPSVIGSVTSLLIHDIDLVVRSPDGVLTWGNENYYAHDKTLHKRGHGDNKNPNEQVYIDKPRCTTSCTYDVFIRAHSLFAKASQNAALVITAHGVITDPVLTHEWFGPEHEPALAPVSRHHNQTYSPFDIALSASLKGAEYTSTSFTIPSCGHLRLVQAKLKYNHLHCGPGEAIPSNIEVTLQAPSGKAVSIGGSDSSVGKARITTEWPDSWNFDINGEYTALIDLTDARIYGVGTWNLYIMNSFSQSGRVTYDFSATLLFYGEVNESCAPTSAPTQVGISKDPYKIPLDPLLAEYDTSYEIPFHSLGLGVHELPSTGNAAVDAPKVLIQDRKVIGTFPFSAGVLQTVQLSLNAYDNYDYETFGTDSWLLAVVVTAPDESVTVQVGGYHWLGRKDNFYYRHWPDPWLGRLSAGQKWISTRDVSAAGLTGSYTGYAVNIKKKGAPQGQWVVELAMGSNYPRNVVNFTGEVTLMFSNKGCEDVICEKKVVRLNTFIGNPPSIADRSKTESFLNFYNFLCIFGAYISLILLLRFVQIVRKPSHDQVAQPAEVREVLGEDHQSSRPNSYGSV